MRKLTWCIILSLTMIMAACAPAALISDQQEAASLSVADYYPFVPDRILSYEGVGSEYADSVEYVDFMENRAVQTRTVTAGTTLASVIRFREDSVVLTFGMEEFYAWGRLFHIPDNRNEVLLQMPLETGNEWELKDGRVRMISGTNVTVSTPAGTFDTLQVTTVGEESTGHVYLAPGIGPVKKVFESGQTRVETNLVSIEEDAAFEITLPMYYPEPDEEAIPYHTVNELFYTNDSIEEKLTDRFNEVPDTDLFPVFPSPVEVLNVSLDPATRRVKVDFSEEILHLNIGTYQEGRILQSITNTLAHFYGMDAVILTVDGGSYESGHYYIGPEDELIPDYTNSKPL